MSAADKILDALRDRMASPQFRRADIAVADYRLITNDAAHVLLEYDREFGDPNTTDISQAMARLFEGRLSAHLDTAKLYPADGAVKLIATVVTDTRRYEDHTNMLCVAETRFIDQQMQEVWQVEENDEGERYLRRVSDEDIGQILSARRQRMALGTRAQFGPSIHASVAVLNPGDKVRVFENRQVKPAVVTQVDASGVTVQIEAATKTTAADKKVPREAVLDYVQLSPTSEKQIRDKLTKYYSDIYPPEFVKDLVRRAHT